MYSHPGGGLRLLGGLSAPRDGEGFRIFGYLIRGEFHRLDALVPRSRFLHRDDGGDGRGGESSRGKGGLKVVAA